MVRGGGDQAMDAAMWLTERAGRGDEATSHHEQNMVVPLYRCRVL